MLLKLYIWPDVDWQMISVRADIGRGAELVDCRIDLVYVVASCNLV
jgi:hypothetical protein